MSSTITITSSRSRQKYWEYFKKEQGTQCLLCKTVLNVNTFECAMYDGNNKNINNIYILCRYCYDKVKGKYLYDIFLYIYAHNHSVPMDTTKD